MKMLMPQQINQINLAAYGDNWHFVGTWDLPTRRPRLTRQQLSAFLGLDAWWCPCPLLAHWKPFSRTKNPGHRSVTERLHHFRALYILNFRVSAEIYDGRFLFVSSVPLRIPDGYECYCGGRRHRATGSSLLHTRKPQHFFGGRTRSSRPSPQHNKVETNCIQAVLFIFRNGNMLMVIGQLELTDPSTPPM